MTQRNVVAEVDDSYLNDASFLERILFSKRPLVMAVYVVLTIFFGYHMLQIRPQASFLRMVPAYHPFIQNFIEYQNELMEMGNIVRICVETTKGSIISL